MKRAAKASAPGGTVAAGRVVLALVILTIALSAVVRFVDLGAYPQYVGDENYYARDASSLLSDGFGTFGVQPWMPGLAQSFAHPELGVEAIAAGIKLFGDGPWGWRVPSAVAGTVLIGLIYPLGRRLRLPPLWALAATVLAASDTLLILQSRLAMLDMFVALGSVACVYFALRAAQSPSSRFWLWVVLCGLAAGGATACKWSGGLAMLAATVLLAAHARSLGGRRVAAACAIVVALTVAIYVASYTPYFVAGHDLGQWLRLQRFMVSFNLSARAIPAQASRAITWPFDVYPIWYHWNSAGGGFARGLLAIGNPLLWWAGIASFVALGVQAVTRRDLRLGVTPFLVAVLYLPWLATSRPAFLYYMTPVAPFIALLVATGLWRLCTPEPADPRASAAAFPGALLLAGGAFGVAGLGQGAGPAGSSPAVRLAAAAAGALSLVAAVLLAGREDPRRPALLSALAWAFVGATAGVAIAFLPFLLGYPVTAEYYRHLMWLPTWW